MTAVHHLPAASPPDAEGRPFYNGANLGKRVQHKSLGIYGRLNGLVRYDRDALWLSVDTNNGTLWWISRNVDFLGPIPAIPSPRFG